MNIYTLIIEEINGTLFEASIKAVDFKNALGFMWSQLSNEQKDQTIKIKVLERNKVLAYTAVL